MGRAPEVAGDPGSRLACDGTGIRWPRRKQRRPPPRIWEGRNCSSMFSSMSCELAWKTLNFFVQKNDKLNIGSLGVFI